jgi:uncharacterized protein (TIGR02266 family)
MRKPMVFPVRFVAEGQTVQSTSRDLDEESVFVRCVEPPERGERVVLRLYLPGVAVGDSLEGEVTETSSEGFRASFTDLPEEAREQIRAALAAGPSAQPAAVETLEQPSARERRLLPRYLDRFSVTLQSARHRSQRESLNLSATGLFIQTDAPPAIDQIVQVILELPDGKPPAETQAIVVHRVVPGDVAAPGAGVQFIAADDDFRARIDAYLEKLRKG